MIKVTVMYPNTPGSRFDHDYYRDVHMPLVHKLMAGKARSYTVDRGIEGGVPGSTPPYIAMCHIFCDSVADFQAGFGPHLKTIMADVPKYTDLAPLVQISEVVVG